MDGITVHAKWQTAEIRELTAKLQAPRLNQALSVAVNDSARQVERAAERLIAKTLSIPAARAKTGVWVRPFSTPATLSATVRGSKSPIPLKVFAAKEAAKGVSARIWGRRTIYPGAFIMGGNFPNRVALGMGGNVMKRVGKSRLPITKVPGAAIAEAMVNDAVSSALVAQSQERIIANVRRQLDRYTRARGKRG